jgi:DNA topoisomerase VI subunit A
VREILESSRVAEYFSFEGLRTLTGLPESRWHYAILKELIDNALDAIDELDEKWVHLEIAGSYLKVSDSGKGISRETLDRIYDFNVYVSSKREFITCTRGVQGNALKTIIAICYLLGLRLGFITGGYEIHYELDSAKLGADIVEFNKTVEPVPEGESGVVVRGHCYHEEELVDTIRAYRLANPDVEFRINGTTFPALTAPVKRNDKMYLHWYDFKRFSQLLQAVTVKEPGRTTKAFCLKFSGTQRVMSSLEFKHRHLADFHMDEKQVRLLFDELRAKVKPPTPKVLARNITGKESIMKAFPGQDIKYKIIYGSYGYEEARIPYAIEGYLLKTLENRKAEVKCTVNNSVPYEAVPFYFSSPAYIEFCRAGYYVTSLGNLLSQSGFFEARGVTLYLNFISPKVDFIEKSKSRIIADRFREDLLKLVEQLCAPVIREVQRARRANQSYTTPAVTTRRASKKELIEKYFMQAYETASGGYLVTARQIFYVLRQVINLEHGVDLKQSDYSAFTQQHVTAMIKRYPELEEKILFERRGVFIEPFTGRELPLGTKDIDEFIRSDGREEPLQAKRVKAYSVPYGSIPLELKYNHVLFIEKAGFNIILQGSGLTRELNLGVMATQGFGTRAAKKLIDYFLMKGMRVYVLHDCDVAGYLIKDKLSSGSSTFEKTLGVEEIGLTLADVKVLGKVSQAEEVTYAKPYTNSLSIFTPEERDFFVVDQEEKRYRRVELNALTTPELLDFIRDKISYQPIRPTQEQVSRVIAVDKEAIIKEALFKAYEGKIDIKLDRDELARSVLDKLDTGKHWMSLLEEELQTWCARSIEKLSGEFKAGR